MKNIYTLLIGSALCVYCTTSNAQRLVAVAGEDSPTAIWALGEVIGGSYESATLQIDQGILSYAAYYGPIPINTEEAEEIALWPNPVYDVLNVSAKENIYPLLISISNSNGMLVGQYYQTQKQEVYNWSPLAAGLYYIRLTDINGTLLATKKIIKL